MRFSIINWRMRKWQNNRSVKRRLRKKLENKFPAIEIGMNNNRKSIFAIVIAVQESPSSFVSGCFETY